MKNRFVKISNVFLSIALCITVFAGCGSRQTESVSYEGDTVHYASSDAGFANFLNDFTRRNLRFDEESVADAAMALGTGTGFAKNWETMSLVWHNSTGNVLGNDKLVAVKNFLRTITQDGYGMIYNTHNTFMPGMSNPGDGISQGWPFPNAKNSAGHCTTYEFNYASEASLWKVGTGGTFSVGTNGYATFAYNAPSADTPFRLINDRVTTSANPDGIEAKHAPVVEIELSYTDANQAIGTETDVEDVSLVWQTEEGGDVWYSAPQSLYATSPETLNYSFSSRKFFSMYLHENWDGQVITSLGIEITPKEGKKLRLTDGKINYIRPGYDTRQSNATYQFLLALGNYISYTNDTKFLEEMLSKARRAVLFLSYVLQGEEGLLDISYLYGHNGIGSDAKDGKLIRHTGDGIGNGYWDILPSSAQCLEANTYFYQALGVMAQLERRASAAGIETAKNVSVKNRTPGGEAVGYEYTADSLQALRAQVKANMEKDIAPVKESDGSYGNDGGFWNPATGRFASGVRADTGAVLDYGYVYLNEEAVVAGIGTEGQRKSILDWISGTRTVSGDTSTGEDIYFYRFAPRSSTLQNSLDYIWTYDETTDYSKSVQNGGAVICWSYYDILSRIGVYGADNAFARFKEIQGWYEDVQEAGGTGTDFYNDYYMYLETGTGVYVPQQSGAQNGAMGLDTEFLESIMLHSAVPFGFFGMDAGKFNTISFTNRLPSRLDWLQIDNMLYGGNTYSVRMERNALIVKNVKGEAREYQFEFCFKEPSGSYSVKVNGKKISDYTVENGYIRVTVPFGNAEVRVG